MKLLRSSLSAALALSLILLSPGGNAWAAMGKIATPVATPRAGITVVPASSFNLRIGANGLSAANASLTPSLNGAAFAAPALDVAPAAAMSAAQNAQTAPISAAAAPVAPAAIAAQSAAQNAPLQAGLEAAGAEAAKFSAPDQGADAAKANAAVRFDLSLVRSAANDGVSVNAAGTEKAGQQLKKGDKGTPDRYDEQGNPKDETGGIDEIGNPRRTGGEGGPDDSRDPDAGRDGGNMPLKVGLAAVGLAGASMMYSGFNFGSLVVFPLIAISLIMHEIGHAKAAASLGDYTATLQNRASFNPKHWWTHVDPMMTIVIPLITMLTAGFMFGGAKPVPVNAYNFRNPVKDMAKVAFAGPAVNFILAMAGSLAVTGAVAAGLGAAVAGTLVTFTFLNVALGIFNLIPLHPLDGSHILRALLPRGASAALDSFYAKLGGMAWVPVIIVAMFGGGFIVGLASGITSLLIAVPMGLTGVKLAGAWAVTTAMLGMALAPSPKKAAADAPAVPAEGGAAVDLVVVFGAGGVQGVTRDNHLSWVDLAQPNGVDMYAQAQQAMTSQIESAGGLGAGALATLGATPIATYRRINAATVRLDAVRAGEFERAMRERGHTVFPNARREIVRPVANEPEKVDPAARGAVTMEENLVITKADKVQAIAKGMWGEPGKGGIAGLWRRLTGAAPVQPKTAVIDSGADTSHPLLSVVKEVKNATTGENIDDIGHGSWVTSMGLNYAPWSKQVTHYKTFLNGGATLDDILKALTMAANDGNLVMSNSWGSDDGDPTSPDSQLVRKLAEEGHIMVFAAGNAGSRPNTIGSPAIVYHRDAATGAIRVLSVAATDRSKKVAYFSSRGPGSYKTKADASYPKRPDLSAIGYNTEGAWPAALRDADRTDPVKGPLKAISGTSMSTPSVYGAILLLLMMFGVTSKGPAADAVVNAVMQTLENTGQGHDNEGDGFMNVQAAYERLVPSRAAIDRWNVMTNARNAAIAVSATVSREGAARNVREDISGRLAAFEGDLAAMAERYPILAQDPKRADRLRRELDTYEYKRLRAELARLQGQASAMRRTGGLTASRPGDQGDELLEYAETQIDPEIAAIKVRMQVIESMNPRVQYDAASRLGRWWLRVTGRGPKA